MCPFLVNKEVPEEAVPQYMQDYLTKTGRKRGKGKKLLRTLSAEKTLFYTPLLQWYLAHGAEITKVHRTINYKPETIFTWFV